jgi:hypothetical protein
MKARAAHWLVGPGTDIGWFILPAVAGYLCLYVNVALGVSSFLIWWFWNVFLNGPHFWATISRTYLDREEWRTRGPILVRGLAWFLVGPAAIVLTVASGSMLPFIAFWFFQVLWAYFHVSRQHWGFVALYQKLNGEPAGGSNRLDWTIFHLLMFGPVLAWFIRYPELRDLLALDAGPTALERVIVAATVPLVLGAIALYAGKEILAFRRHGTINVPKTLILVAYVPLHLLLLLHPTVAGRYDILLFNAVITLPHNLQYLAIVWFHNRNRYGPDRATHRLGWATAANAGVGRFVVLGLLFSVGVFYTRWFFEGQEVPLSLGRYHGAHVPIGGALRVSDLVFAIWIGVVFNHQYLDQKIWKISKDARLNTDLRLQTTTDRQLSDALAPAT